MGAGDIVCAIVGASDTVGDTVGTAVGVGVVGGAVGGAVGARDGDAVGACDSEGAGVGAGVGGGGIVTETVRTSWGAAPPSFDVNDASSSGSSADSSANA